MAEKGINSFSFWIYGIFVTVMLSMVGYIWANDQKRTDEDTKIRAEIKTADEKIEDKVSQSVDKILTKIEEMQKEQTQINTEQSKILTKIAVKVEYIEKKIAP